jgi:hypothetical protein
LSPKKNGDDFIAQKWMTSRTSEATQNKQHEKQKSTRLSVFDKCH